MVANYKNITEQEVKEQLHSTTDIKITMTSLFQHPPSTMEYIRVRKPLSKAFIDFVMLFSTLRTLTSENNPFCSPLKVQQAESQQLALCHIATLIKIMNRLLLLFLQSCSIKTKNYLPKRLILRTEEHCCDQPYNAICHSGKYTDTQ